MEHSGDKFSSSRILKYPQFSLPALVLLLWVMAVLTFILLSEKSSGRAVVTVTAYWLAAAFALGAVGYAAWRVEGKLRLFWVLLGMGLLAEVFGYLFWQTVGQASFLSLNVTIQDAAYFFSYSLLFVALIYLVALNTKGMAPLCPLDVIGVMVPAGLLTWYFVLGPASFSGGHPENLRHIIVNLYGPVAGAGFVFLCMLVLSNRSSPPFARWLIGGFSTFLAGDLLCAEMNPFGLYESGHWPELFWSLGVAMFGLAALRASSEHARLSVELPEEIKPWKALAFWIGPLSPAVQYAFLLSWATLHPPVPPYVSWAGVALVLYFALRTPAFHHVERGLRLEGERRARSGEQERISRELHDTVKQNVAGTSMILKACKDAHGSGDSATVEELLGQASETCGEAGYQLSKPIDELAVFTGNGASEPTIYLTNRTRTFGEYFGLESHTDLQAPLEELCPAEVSVAQRVVIEAFWNVAKHSCARNLWLESLWDDVGFVVRVRDDGRGFCSGEETGGMGLGFMRSRATEVGAVLRVVSEPGESTTVELRFPKKR